MFGEIIILWIDPVKKKPFWKATRETESPLSKNSLDDDDKHQREANLAILSFVLKLRTSGNM